MTDLSPAAQAVLNAYENFPQKWPFYQGEQKAIASALRALADQVVPPSLEKEFYDRNPSLTLQKAVEVRAEILAIAAGLEGANG